MENIKKENESKKENEAKNEKKCSCEKHHKNENKKTLKSNAINALLEENEKLKIELSEKSNAFLLKIAEYENIKKRITKDKEEFFKYASERVILKTLEINDNIERAIDSSEKTKDFKSLVEGVKLIQEQIKKLLQTEEVEAIKCLKEEFDPYLHHAMLQEESDEPNNTIIAELQKGYMLKDKVIRPSLVKVSKNSKKL